MQPNGGFRRTAVQPKTPFALTTDLNSTLRPGGFAFRLTLSYTIIRLFTRSVARKCAGHLKHHKVSARWIVLSKPPVVCRVEGAVSCPSPHRTGREQFAHPVRR